jgi:PKD repeat protein
VGCNATPTISTSTLANGQVNYSTNMFGLNNLTWNFGDGNSISGGGAQSFGSHTYTTSGVYTILLTAVIPGGICTYTASKTVTVTVVPCTLAANFSFVLGANGLVNFSSTSTGTSSGTSYYWNFGNGNAGYNFSNYAQTYTANNTYTVMLQVQDSANFPCMSSISKTLSITNALCPNNTNFMILKDSSQAFTWNAYPFYPSNISNVSWSWGDGSSNSNSMYPSHTFSAAGVYTICLSATVSCGSSTSTCIGSSIYKPSPNGENGAMIQFNVIDPSNPVSIKENSSSNSISVSIFPNPSGGKLSIEAVGIKNGAELGIKIYDLLGHLVAVDGFNSGGQAHVTDLGTLENGIYIVRIVGENVNYSERVVLQK